MTLRTAVILTLGSITAATTAILTLLAGGSGAQAVLAAGVAFGGAVPALHRLIAAESPEADRG
ncbi:hypothetical protein H3146_07875 [Streptomyces sp. OF3]|uniref:Major facilitator superfamily (MFS) profile domain-containing protein n=2 Tax=Streptomyces alkaliterrae TaxID=2213162 RepID=A0A5P0YMT5_9ACTN|nr:hypothetical protein [Streptomyces alkaliterrae]MBB1259587.1 hypothetical protein [Streptomyces alkaliterrae]MQS00987.1 hypothetical protein [Streptomyces alkaliterrae]